MGVNPENPHKHAQGIVTHCYRGYQVASARIGQSHHVMKVGYANQYTSTADLGFSNIDEVTVTLWNHKAWNIKEEERYTLPSEGRLI